MTTKDVLKLLLISIGYDKKIEINSHRTDDGSYYYEISGYNNDNDDFHFDGYGILDCINSFLNELKYYPEITEEPMFGNTTMMLYSTKDILNDEFRENIYNKRKEQDEKVKKYCEETKYITEWQKENNPCTNCTDNKKDHWDSIHYNCEEHHTMRCKKLLDFNDATTKMYQTHKSNEIKKEFLSLVDNPKKFMNLMNYNYDENISHNKNCINFLNELEKNNQLNELKSLMNKLTDV